MKTKIIKNFIKDKDLFESLIHHFTFEVPHYFGHTSDHEEPDKINKGFYTCQFNSQAQPYKSIVEKIKKLISFNVKRMYINVQHKGMEGEFHVDHDSDKDVTALLMIRGDGPFEIKDESKYFLEPNTLVLFQANKLHRGHAPINHSPRITLAIKCKIL